MCTLFFISLICNSHKSVTLQSNVYTLKNKHYSQRVTLCRMIFYLSLLFLFFYLQEAYSDETREITIAESITEALSNNPDLEISLARIQAAAAKMEQVRSAFMPRLTLENEYMRIDAPQWIFAKTIDSRLLSFETDFNYPRPIHNYESGVSLHYNIFRGGQDWYGFKKAQKGTAMEKSQYREKVNRLVFLVISGYYDVLSAQEQIKVVQDSIKTVEAQLHNTQVLYEGGAALKADLLSLQVRRAEEKERLIVVQNGYELSRIVFANILGIPSEPAFSLLKEEWDPGPLPESIEDALKIAESTRDLIKVAEHGIKQAESAMKQARGGYFPELNFRGRYYYDDDDLGYDGSRKNWFLSLRMDWNVFDGFLTKERVNESRARHQESRAMLTRAHLEVEKDVRSAYLRLEEARKRLDVTSQSVVQAEEALRLVRLSFEGGAVGITRYLDAQLAMTVAQTQYVKANYDLKKAIAQCFHAIGYCSICVLGPEK
jgi:outer membrane protein